MHMLIPPQSGSMSPSGVADAFEWPVGEQPWVRGVMVATADGAARGPSGLSGGISSASDRLVFATIRGMADVILVGSGTVRQEGYGPRNKARPELADRRAALGQSPISRIAIVTASGNLDETSPLFTESSEPPILLVTSSMPDDRRAALAPVAEIIEAGVDRVETGRAIAALAEMGMTRIACEGGPTLLGQLAAEGNLDELCLTVTPLLSGGVYADHPVPRILDGSALADSPQPIRLKHVIESDGTLFLSYIIN